MKFTKKDLVEIDVCFENKDERKSFIRFELDNDIIAEYTPLRSPKNMVAFFNPDDAAKVEQYLTNQISKHTSK